MRFAHIKCGFVLHKALTGVILSVMLSGQSFAASADVIADKKAAILTYLHTLQHEAKSLVGVQVDEFEVYADCNSADRLKTMTGVTPAVVGLELMNVISVPPYRDYLMDRALSQSKQGGLVTLSWHQRNPLALCPRGEAFECVQRPMADADLALMLKPGTPENALWLADVDAMAKTLRQLQSRGIIVLFRPYHEMNGGWFWWGKQELYPQLWDALYEELTIHQKIRNLIWVWASDRDSPDAVRFMPRKYMPDIVGIDVYENSNDSPKFRLGRDNLAKVFGNTPFAVTEVGKAPSSAVMNNIHPIWVLLWGGSYLNSAWSPKGDCIQCNTPDDVRSFVKGERIVSLEGLPPDLKNKISAHIKNAKPLQHNNTSCPLTLR